MVENRTRDRTLAGRTAVVTGGAGALGEALAVRLRANGARVARWDLREGGGDDPVVVLDVTDEQADSGAGVLVTCITPAVVEGGLASEASADELAALRALIPMKRFCTAEEVAAMVSFLASDDCSFSTGAVFDLSGGRATY